MFGGTVNPWCVDLGKGQGERRILRELQGTKYWEQKIDGVVDELCAIALRTKTLSPLTATASLLNGSDPHG
jgi:hypothetical protein